MPQKKSRSKRRPRTRNQSNRIRDLGKLEPRRKLHNGDASPGKRGIDMPYKVAIAEGKISLVNRDGRALDARTREVRRFLDVLNDLLSDMGGTDNVSTAEMHLAARAAFHAMLLERAEGDHLSGVQPVDLATYLPMSKSLVTLLSKIGLRRRAKNVNGQQPSLQDIRAGRATSTVYDAEWSEASDD